MCRFKVIYKILVDKELTLKLLYFDLNKHYKIVPSSYTLLTIYLSLIFCNY